MQGIHEAESSDGSSAPPPPDWPAPGAPLPGDEPTMELPVIAESAAAGTSTPTLAQAALSLALSKPARRAKVRSRKAARAPETPELSGFAALPALAEFAGFSSQDPAPENERAPENDPAPEDEHAPENEHGPEDEHAPEGPAEPGRRWLIAAGIAAVALLLTGATVIMLSRGSEASRADSGSWSPPPAAAPVPSHTASAALDGRTTAGFDLVDGARNVTLRAIDLGDSLYRISTPAGSNAVPRAEDRDGRIRLHLAGDAQSVDVALNAAVRWDLRMTGGADLSTIDLSAGRVGGVDLTGGASRITLTLPRPDGTLSVRMSGGVSLFDVRTAGRVPVRVRVGSGAGQVTLDGRSHSGVAAGKIFTPDLWAEAVDRVDVDAAAGMSTLTVAPY
jgi:hypothetical protein